MKEPRIFALGHIESFSAVKKIGKIGKIDIFFHKEWKNLYYINIPSVSYLSIGCITFFKDK